MRIRKRHIGITIDGMNSEIHTMESKTGAEAPVLAKHFEVADGTPTHDDRNHNPLINTFPDVDQNSSHIPNHCHH
jgi:hypothetical protein